MARQTAFDVQLGNGAKLYLVVVVSSILYLLDTHVSAA